ncbi:hypothetical protein [Oceanobacter mangrovi]|uniref:hypothetical protein n=1 Tax=Oceanobacter mangrovi TaxID=2862510 RepID=UPI001C8D62AA|nr:hypothetical protein [Oceanobacter mangrovi]
MINLEKLYDDEAYALKVLIGLIDKYVTDSEEKVNHIRMVASFPGTIPGRKVGGIFHGFKISECDQRIIQEIINIYG